MNIDPKNRWRNDSESAQDKDTQKSKSAPGVPEQPNTTPYRIYDLELDSSLRAFTRISNDKNFVNEVMEKVAQSKSNVSSVSKSGPRLQTIDPVFSVPSDQDDDDLVVLEKQLATAINTNQTLKPQVANRPASGRLRVVVIASCLFLAVIAAYYFIPANNAIDQPQSANSEDTTTNEKILAQSENPNAPTPPKDLASDGSLETLKQLSGDLPSDGIKIPLQNDWVKVKETTDAGEKNALESPAGTTPLVASSDSQDAIIDSDSKWSLDLRLDGKGKGSLRINNFVISNDVLVIHSPDVIRGIGSLAAQRLAFLQPRIGKRIGGSVTIWNRRYDFKDPAEIEQTINEAVFLLDVQSSFEDRAQWLKRLVASETHNLSSEADLVAKKAMLTKELETALKLWTDRQAKAASETNVRPDSLSSDQLARHVKIRNSLYSSNHYKPSLDEMVVLEETIKQTEAFLRGLAEERLAWDRRVHLGKISAKEASALDRSQDSLATDNQISALAFKNFVANQSELVIPVDERLLLSSDELKAQGENPDGFDPPSEIDAFPVVE